MTDLREVGTVEASTTTASRAHAGRVAMTVPATARSWRFPRLRRNATEIVGLTALLAGVFAVHHGWLTTTPVSAGDWPWLDEQQARPYVPWPHVIDGSVGVGSPDFSGLNSAPFRFAIGGLISLGVSSGLAEKLLVFFPFCILSVLSPWLLAREVLPRRRWALLAALLFAANTQVIDYARGEMGIGVAVTLAPLVLWSHLRALRTGRMWRQAATGALLTVLAVYDLRIAYVVVLVLAIEYLVELCVRRVPLRVLAQGAVIGAVVFICLSLYWLLPLAAYHGSQHLPIYPSVFVAFATLPHAFAAQDPFWTGGGLDIFHTSPVDPIALAVPLIAVVALAWRRRFPAPLVWLALAFALFAFMLKQQNGPFGGAYLWFFFNFPGGRLFRESSKFAWVAVTAVSILAAYAVSELWPARGGGQSAIRWLRLRLSARIARALRAALAGGLAMSLLAVAVWHFIPLARGDIGWTTVATPLPSSFATLQEMLTADRQPSTVAWLGTAVVNDGDQGHLFRIESPEHPLLELNGFTSPLSSFAGAFDPWYRYCPGGAVPFCYVQPGLLPVLAKWYGVGYIVAPLGDDVGQLPQGVVRGRLVDDIGRALYDNPLVLGAATQQLAVWRVNDHVGGAYGAPAVARIAGRAEDTVHAVPALAFLNLPPVYTDPGLDGVVSPGDTKVAGITVVPQRDGAYRVDHGGSYAAVLPESAAGPPTVDVGGTTQSVGWLTPPRNGFRMAGPLLLDRGTSVIDQRLNGAPLVAWTTDTENLTAGGGVSSVPYSHADSESFTVDARCCAVVGVTSQYDDQWKAQTSTIHFAVAGEFNGYAVSGHPSKVGVSFGLRSIELAGAFISVAFAMALIVLRVVGGGHRLRRAPALPTAMGVGRTARILLVACMVWAVLAWALLFAQWFGLPYVFAVIAPSTNLATPADAVAEALFASLACLAAGGLMILARAATLRGRGRLGGEAD